MGDELRIWTTTGSAGTLNQADLAKVSLHQSIIQLGAEIITHPVAQAGGPVSTGTIQAVVRYNVVPVDGLFPTSRFFYGLQIRFKNHVTAKLIEVDLNTGAENALVNFDSQNPSTQINPPDSTGFQVGTATAAANSTVMDFLNKAYYVEATLIAPRLAVDRAAEISIIKVLAALDSGGH